MIGCICLGGIADQTGVLGSNALLHDSTGLSAVIEIILAFVFALAILAITSKQKNDAVAGRGRDRSYPDAGSHPGDWPYRYLCQSCPLLQSRSVGRPFFPCLPAGVYRCASCRRRLGCAGVSSGKKEVNKAYPGSFCQIKEQGIRPCSFCFLDFTWCRKYGHPHRPDRGRCKRSRSAHGPGGRHRSAHQDGPLRGAPDLRELR